MDFPTIANLLLFTGAIGASFMLDSGPSNTNDTPESDPHSADDTARADQGSDTDEAVAADRDMLAWFLYGGHDTVASASGVDSAQGSAGETEDAPLSAAAPDHPDSAAEDTDPAFDTRWTDSGAFHITDFAAGHDSIEILYVPHYDAQTSLEIPPKLEVQDAPDGESAIILLDGVAVGQVDGAAGLDAARIVLTPDHAAEATLPEEEGDDVLHGDGDDDDILGAALPQGTGGAEVMPGLARGAAGDGTMSGLDGADTLFGDDADDALVPSHDDAADGDPSQDTYEINPHWDSEDEIARITDFVGGSDVLELHYTPTFDASGAEIPPLVTLVPMTGATMIVVDAQPVALLDGSLDVSLSDIALIAA